jgi:hypothetical protein
MSDALKPDAALSVRGVSPHGGLAYLAGHPATANPWRAGSKDRAIWLEEWNYQARNHRRQPYAEAAPSEAEPKPDVNGWLPIESCPQDGTWFLACNASSRFLIARPIGPGADEFEDFFHLDYLSEKPTHWHPLPAPPVSA